MPTVNFYAYFQITPVSDDYLTNIKLLSTMCPHVLMGPHYHWKFGYLDICLPICHPVCLYIYLFACLKLRSQPCNSQDPPQGQEASTFCFLLIRGYPLITLVQQLPFWTLPSPCELFFYSPLPPFSLCLFMYGNCCP